MSTTTTNVQYLTATRDSVALENTETGREAAEDRQILNGVTLVRCQTGPHTLEGDEDTAAELICLPSDPLPGHQITIVPLKERSIGIVPHPDRSHTINNLPMLKKRIAVYSFYMLIPVSYLRCVYANGNWVIDATLANGERTLLLETTTNSSAYVDRDSF